MMGVISGLGSHFGAIPEVQQLAEAFGFVKHVPRRREVESHEAPRPKRTPKKRPKPEESSDDNVIDLKLGSDGTFRKV